jgi:signal transduction histidine kinase
VTTRGDRLRRLFDRDVVALPLFAVLDLLTASSVIIHDAPVRDARVLVQVLVAAAGFSILVWRRRAPFTVFGLLCLHGVLGWRYVPEYRPWAALIVALYTVTVYRPAPIAAGAVVAAVAQSGLSGLDSFRAEPVPDARMSEFVVTVLMYALIYLATWGAGVMVRNHRARLKQLEGSRLQAREEAITQERRRIAAELHDVVSNAVTVMVLQAAGAAQHTGTDPDRVHGVLLQIRNTGQQAMAELRRLLGVLQLPDRSPPLGAVAPQPCLLDIDVLLASVRQAGLSIELVRTGVERQLDPSVELAAYRVVQESLTNILKHAGEGATARICLAWEEQVLMLQVEDNGGRPRPGLGLSGGYGLAGLAERIRSTGGRFSAAPITGGGYRVAATLPIAGTALAGDPAWASGVRHDTQAGS